MFQNHLIVSSQIIFLSFKVLQLSNFLSFKEMLYSKKLLKKQLEFTKISRILLKKFCEFRPSLFFLGWPVSNGLYLFVIAPPSPKFQDKEWNCLRPNTLLHIKKHIFLFMRSNLFKNVVSASEKYKKENAKST